MVFSGTSNFHSYLFFFILQLLEKCLKVRSMQVFWEEYLNWGQSYLQNFECYENTHTSSSMFYRYAFLQYWIWTVLGSFTGYTIFRSRKGDFLSTHSILTCYCTLLSLKCCFCFRIFKSKTGRWDYLINMWDLEFHVTSSIVGFRNT